MGRAHFAKLAGALCPAASNLCVFVHHEINTAKWMIILGIIEFLTTHELRTQWLKKVSPRLRLVVKREFILVMGLEWRRGRDRTIARGAMTSPQQLWPFWIIAVTSLMTTKLCSGLTVWYADLVDPTLSPANLQVSCLSLWGYWSQSCRRYREKTETDGTC